LDENQCCEEGLTGLNIMLVKQRTLSFKTKFFVSTHQQDTTNKKKPNQW
jgi:hypothetical protein